MDFFSARAGVDRSRLGNYSPFYAGGQLSGSMYAYGQLGADTALITPSLENWTAEDQRLLDILGSKGTNSPEGKALIADLEAQYGAGNWYPAWVQMQDELTAKYNAAQSDAERLSALQASTTDKDYGTQFVPAGAIPYSLHDINAFAEMTAEQQAEFLLGFSDPNAAGYFAAASGATKPGVQQLMDAALGIKYMGNDGVLYDSYEAMIAAGAKSPGVVTQVTTASGEVITDPTRLENLTHEEVFGPAPQPVTGGFFPGDITAGQGIDEAAQGLPKESGYPVVTSPEFAPTPSCSPGYVWDTASQRCVPQTSTMFPKPTGGAAPVVPSTALDVVDVTKTGTPVNVKGQPKNLTWGTESFTPTPTPTVLTEDELPPSVAGIGGGALGMIALLGLGLAVLAAPKRRK